MGQRAFILSYLLLITLSACGSDALIGGSADMASATPGGSQDAGYFRATLRSGAIPQPDDINVEGFLGEHDIASPLQGCEQSLCMSGTVVHDRAIAEGSSATLVHLGMGTNVDLSEQPRAPLNLAVVVDVSGSMSASGRLDFVKQGLLLMVDELGEEDRLAIVTYSSEASVLVPSQPVGDKRWLSQTIRSLSPGGSTNLHGGMMAGYAEVAEHLSEESLPRIMLLSDGLVNTGEVNSEIILRDSKVYNDRGIGISTIGVGLDFNQELMRGLSQQGGGNFYFLEDPAKAARVFLDELDVLVTPIANNLKITLTLSEGFTMIDTYGLPHTWEGSNQLVVEVPTVFASRRGGAMLIRVDHESLSSLGAASVVLEITYQYDEVTTGETQSEPVLLSDDVILGEAIVEAEQSYDNEGSLKAMVVWNMVTTFQAASRLAHNGGYDQALTLIQVLAEYVEENNRILKDKEITRDVDELISLYIQNLGGYWNEPYCYDDGYCEYYDGYYYGDDHYYGGCSAAPNLPFWGALAIVGFALTRRRKRAGLCQ
jgi:Ca-activated chloride channel family protein